MTNTEIELKIFRAIQSGKNRNMEIHFSDVALKPLDFRVIDRRIQSLRKAGKIAYTAKEGWRIVN